MKQIQKKMKWTEWVALGKPSYYLSQGQVKFLDDRKYRRYNGGGLKLKIAEYFSFKIIRI